MTPRQKEHNQAISTERIRVEHSIGGIKVFGIVRQVFETCVRVLMTWRWKVPVVCIICVVINP